MKTNTLIHLGSRKSISPSSILLLKADINYTIIFLDDGSKLLSSTTIGVLEKRLKGFNFFRPNRSFIINLQFIEQFQDKATTGHLPNILLKNKDAITLSRRKTTEFLKITL